MRKLAPLFMALVLAVSTTTAVFAGGNSALQYTFTFTDLGQPGAHGGGRLFAGGRAEGGLTLSALNGQVIEQLQATGWSEVVPGVLVDVCFDVQSLKGPSLLPPSFCLDGRSFNCTLGPPTIPST